jgi:hypothetical protein
MPRLRASSSLTPCSAGYWRPSSVIFFEQKCAVVAKTDAALGLGEEQSMKTNSPDLCILTHHIRFAAGAFHFRERPQLFRPDLQPRLHFGPHQALVAGLIHVKPRLLRRQQLIALFWG